MNRRKRFLITTERYERMIICSQGRNNGGSPELNRFCEQCDARREFRSLAEAVTASGIGAREIIRRMSTDEVHAIEAADGQLLICVASLKQ